MLSRYLFTIVVLFSLLPAIAQDKQELAQEKAMSSKIKGEHPVAEYMRTKPSALRKELEGVHPRVFFTQAEIDGLKRKTETQKELWANAVRRVRALMSDPLPAPAEVRRAHNDVGLAIAEAAFIYKVTGDKKYLDGAKKYMDAAVSYPYWGYSYNKPDVDLAAGHILYGLGWAYDLLYNELTPAERSKYRDKLVRQCKLMYDYFKVKSGKRYAYSQNHTFIPLTGLGVASYALMGEVPEAKDWAALTRGIYERVLATYSKDGYYYEGMEYWIFSTPWLIHYMDAHQHSTGEDLYQLTPGLKLAHKYAAHATLPGGEFNFDFGDIYSGPETRARKGEDYERERVNGHFRTNYNLLYHLASVYNSGEAQGVADWLKSKGQVNSEEFWTFVWYKPEIKAVPIERQEKWHYFADHGVVYWRSGWDDNATAFAFKAGPSEGHATKELVDKYPDWRLSSGHAHPDAGSFIIWSKGRYLTGDSGYAGVPMTEHHNTVVFAGKGQAREGTGHDVWLEIPYERLDRITISDVKADDKHLSLVADLTSAYEPEVGVKSFRRKFEFTAPGSWTITDSISTTKPEVVTAYFHADDKILPRREGVFEIAPGSPSLLAQVTASTPIETKVEKNILTAQGPPGNVDKGPQEERGVRLAVTTAKPVDKLDLVTTLKLSS